MGGYNSGNPNPPQKFAPGQGAPKGNRNAANAKDFQRQLKQVFAAKAGGDYLQGLYALGEVLWEEAMIKHKPWAILEAIERIDGKTPIVAEDKNGDSVPLEEIAIRGIAAALDRTP